MKQLTKKQALEHGYTYAQFDDNFKKIESIEDDDILKNEWTVSSKETTQRHISDKELFELVSEHIECDDTFFDDDSVVSDLIEKKVDWALFSSQINEALSVLKYHMPTKFQLVP